MTALRQLSFVYVVAAGSYAIALALSSHPDWSRNAQQAASYVEVHGGRTAVAFNDQVLRPGLIVAEGTGKAIAQDIFGSSHAPPREVGAPVRMAAATPRPRVAVARTTPSGPLPGSFPSDDEISPPQSRAVPSEAPIARPAEPVLRVPDEAPPAVASVNPTPRPSTTPRPTFEPPPRAVASLPPTPAAGDIIQVTERLRENLTSEMLANFELFLYVSKADAGPWAQRMYVFQKQKSGDLTLLYNWPVSTGREKMELNPEGRRLATDTPPGYYELDSHRSFAHYDSTEWGKPMPYAMFFNWVKDGNQTGLAIHAASGDDVPLLGRRASAGCIHLSEDNARTLFTMIRAQYRGLAPRFAVDRRTGTMSNDGILLHDAKGKVELADGYKVLIFIENFGGQNVVAALF